MRLALLALLTLPLAAAEYITTEVTINGAGPFRLLVDTGASSTSQDPEAAKAAGLKPLYSVHLTTLTGEALVPAAIAQSVRAGKTTAGDVEILIHSTSAIHTVEPGVQGVLGQSFLSRIPWMMDYTKGRFVTGELAVASSERLSAVQFSRTGDSRIILPLRIGGAAFRVALDSGASHLVLHCGARCPLVSNPDSTRQVLTSLGAARATVGNAHDVSAGALTRKQAVAVLIEAGHPEAQVDGVLPAAWFRRVFADNSAGALKVGR